MGRVVAFKPREAASAQEAFREAWSAFPETGRLRSSRQESYKAWQKALKQITEPELLAAVRRYVAEDKEHRKEHGAPGFHRWLSWGRYDNWLEPALIAPIRPTFPDPAIRAEVVARMGEAWCGAYLDPCTVEGTTLIARTSIAITRMMEQRVMFKALGFTGMRKAK